MVPKGSIFALYGAPESNLEGNRSRLSPRHARGDALVPFSGGICTPGRQADQRADASASATTPSLLAWDGEAWFEHSAVMAEF